MGKNIETRDILLFLIFALLLINTLINLPIKKAVADTFLVDNCITVRPEEKPTAYLHVVTH